MDTLLKNAGKGVGVTDLSRRLKGFEQATAGQSQERLSRSGPRRTVTGSFRLAAGVSKQIIAINNFRTLLVIQNQDVAQKLFFNFGGPANARSGFIVPQGNIYVDYNCMTDSVWVFSTVDLSGYFIEGAPLAA